MCFYISDKKSEKKARTAGRNIVCYKVGIIKGSFRLKSEIFQSEMRNFEYWFNIEYRNKKLTVEKTHMYGGSVFAHINHGFHSFTDKNMAMENAGKHQRVVKCYIPKGAKYYINSNYKEYVSNKIIIKSLVKA